MGVIPQAFRNRQSVLIVSFGEVKSGFSCYGKIKMRCPAIPIVSAMKYQVLDQIFNKRNAPRTIEQLQINSQWQITGISKQAQRFAHFPKQIFIGNDVREGFPELVGIEDILLKLLDHTEELFTLEGIYRSQPDEVNYYIDIHIFGENNQADQSQSLIILIVDVTDRMIASQRYTQRINEANLLSSMLIAYKNYMDQVLAAIADALIVTDKSGKIKRVNSATIDLFGYSEEELINKSIAQIIDENQIIQQAIQQRTLFDRYFREFEAVCRTKSKEKLLISFSCSLVNKKIEGNEDIVYIGRDITTRKLRQQRVATQSIITRILSESNALKTSIQEILRVICQGLDWDIGELWTASQYLPSPGKEQGANPVLRCVQIWSSRAVNARNFKATTWQTTYTPSVGIPGRIWSMETPIWIRDIAEEGDGVPFYKGDNYLGRTHNAIAAGLHAAFGFPIADEKQTFGVMVFWSREIQAPDADLLQMMVSVGSQIAEFIKRKHYEEALFASEQRYRDLFENANDLIQSVDMTGKFVYVNRAWYETMGYSPVEVQHLNVFDIIHPDYRRHCREIFLRVVAGEKIENVEVTFITKDNKHIILEGNINCQFVDGTPTATRGIFRDITHRVQAEAALRIQQEQTEQLLLNILPEPIANRLKIQPGNIAEHFTEVSVLFADIVGFTEISSQLSAIQLVELLNQIFSSFDRLCDRYQLEKIKTIGDAYMVVSGLPQRRSDHAEAIANMALDMLTEISRFNQVNHLDFNIRIGIHSGSVVAGVIGIKKFTYDLWGDTVNIASRMESHGIVGKIQVSEDTYNLIRDRFVMEKRGVIQVKGKGLMTTYILQEGSRE